MKIAQDTAGCGFKVRRNDMPRRLLATDDKVFTVDFH
jgi:hypothetical protein